MGSLNRIAAEGYYAPAVHELVKDGPLRAALGAPDENNRYSLDQLERLPPADAQRIIGFLDVQKGLGNGAAFSGFIAALSLLGPASAVGAGAGLLCLALMGAQGVHATFRPRPIG